MTRTKRFHSHLAIALLPATLAAAAERSPAIDLTADSDLSRALADAGVTEASYGPSPTPQIRPTTPPKPTRIVNGNCDKSIFVAAGAMERRFAALCAPGPTRTCHPSIQAAINAAMPGQFVTIGSGRWDITNGGGSIGINNSSIGIFADNAGLSTYEVTLVSGDTPSGGFAVGIDFRSSDFVCIDGLRVDHQGPMPAIEMMGTTGDAAIRNTFQNGAIQVTSSDVFMTVRMSGVLNTFYRNLFVSDGDDGDWAGIFIDGPVNALVPQIFENRFDGFVLGVEVFNNSGGAISPLFTRVAIVDNIIWNTEAGVYLEGSLSSGINDASVYGNIISGVTNAFGVLTNFTNRSNVVGNRISGVQTGISINFDFETIVEASEITVTQAGSGVSTFNSDQCRYTTNYVGTIDGIGTVGFEWAGGGAHQRTGGAIYNFNCGTRGVAPAGSPQPATINVPSPTC